MCHKLSAYVEFPPKSLYMIGVSYGAAMRRSTLVIAVVCLAAILLGCIEQDGEMVRPAETELVLSDYLELFKKDVIIVIGNNASGIEIEGADAIVENLFNLTGNMPVIQTDAEITEDELAGHNLILVDGADSNEVLREAYDMTDVMMRVTDEYPGAGKCVLEMLRNPWNEEKAVLLVVGSDEWGVKAGSRKLGQIQEFNKASIVVQFVETDSKRRKVGSYLSLLIDTKGFQEYYSVDIEFSHELSNKELIEIEETYNLNFSRLPDGTIAHTDRFYGGLVDGYAIDQLVERSDVIRIASTEKPVALLQGEQGVI